jgi:hypothetical protein
MIKIYVMRNHEVCCFVVFRKTDLVSVASDVPEEHVLRHCVVRNWTVWWTYWKSQPVRAWQKERQMLREPEWLVRLGWDELTGGSVVCTTLSKCSLVEETKSLSETGICVKILADVVVRRVWNHIIFLVSVRSCCLLSSRRKWKFQRYPVLAVQEIFKLALRQDIYAANIVCFRSFDWKKSWLTAYGDTLCYCAIWQGVI